MVGRTEGTTSTLDRHESSSQIEDPQDLTNADLAAMERTPDPRLRQILGGLTRHLHAFVVEVELTEEEFRTGVALINEMGQLSNDSHNETMLMAGSLGVSSLVCMLNNPVRNGQRTSQSLLGPFWRLNSPKIENGGSIVRSDVGGSTMFVQGQIVDREGQPVSDAEVDVWQCSPEGLYENQDAGQDEMNLRGKLKTDSAGRFWFRSVKPIGYPIPTEGVVGRLLKSQKRHPFRPAHVHVFASKPGYRTLISQLYIPDDENLFSDAQFGVAANLIGRLEKHEEPHSDAQEVEAPWYTLDQTFVMERGDSKLPRPPIK
jgi:catechol 1,2-dioxygenase